MDQPAIPDPRVVLREHGLRPKGSWSQNFLIAEGVRRRIAQAVTAGPPPVVVELGAGLGTLTLELLPRARAVVAVEKDRELLPILEQLLRPFPQATVVDANAATLDLAALPLPEGPLRLVGNLPYHLSTPILANLIRQRHLVEGIWIMLQREVARRLAAPPGGRAHGALSLLCQLTCDVKIALTVPRTAFHPRPKVDSAVLALSPLPRLRYDVPSLPLFQRVTQAALGQRRKTVSNALSAGLHLPKTTVADALTQASIPAGVRGETLHLDQLARLCWALALHLTPNADAEAQG